jgi:uncharacterized FAD-dependent dehydrogenase
MNENYDVVIVGGGPAGIFAALELSQIDLDICIIDYGVSADARNKTDILHGWGGAGAFSDGKLTLGHKTGGHLSEILSKADLSKYIDYVDSQYVYYGAPGTVYGTNKDDIDAIATDARQYGLKLVHSPIRHIGIA